MKTIIAGSRNITDYEIVLTAIKNSGFEKDITTIVSGTAAGVDTLGEIYAEENNLLIEKYPANWALGNSAGYIRNGEMAFVSDALIAIWDGKSKGTKHMIDLANKQKLKVYVHNLGENNV